jgi:hypothetical protein
LPRPGRFPPPPPPKGRLLMPVSLKLAFSWSTVCRSGCSKFCQKYCRAYTLLCCTLKTRYIVKVNIDTLVFNIDMTYKNNCLYYNTFLVYSQVKHFICLCAVHDYAVFRQSIPVVYRSIQMQYIVNSHITTISSVAGDRFDYLLAIIRRTRGSISLMCFVPCIFIHE